MSYKTVYASSLINSPPEKETLPLPFIADVFVNGGLNYLALFDPNASIIVHCGPVPGAAGGDTLDLYWIGSDGTERCVSSQILKEDEYIVTVVLSVAEVLRAGEGVSIVYYKWFDGFDLGSPSLKLPVTIKLTVPGDPYGSGENDSATPYINEALPAPTVSPNPIYEADLASGAQVTIQPWDNMSEGDVLLLNWGGISLKQPALEMGNEDKVIVIIVDEETIKSAGNSDTLPVRYEIRDIVNNWSLKSLPALVDVNTDQNLLDAPIVVEELGGVLDYDRLAGSAVNVIVETTQAGISIDDKVILYWSGNTAQNSPIQKEYEDKVITNKLLFQVPNADVALFIGGNVSVSYKVFPITSETPLPSRDSYFTVLGVQRDLPAPQLLDGLTGSVFEPEAVPATGARVALVAYPGMDEDDRIILSWEGETSEGLALHGSDDQTLEDSDVGKNFVFTIDKSGLLPLGDATVLTFSYIVIFAFSGGIRPSAPVSYDVKQRALIKPEVPLAYGADLDKLNFDNMYNDTFLTVEVPYSTQILPGDKVRVTWEGSVIYHSEITLIDVPGTLTFKIPRLEVIDIIGRSARITYTLYHLDKTTSESDELILHVDAYPIDLPAPRITDLKVTVYYPDITDGDKGRVRWSGAVVHDTQEQYLEAGRIEEFNIPSAWFSESKGTAVLVNYSVLTDRDSERLMFSRVLRINL